MDTKKKHIWLWILDLGINIIIIIGLVIVIQTWIIAPFDVYGSSMCDTLNFIDDECQNAYGEKIIVNEALYIFSSPQRGDIVVFSIDDSKNPNKEERYLIKRIIGLPGETIEIKDRYVYVTKKGSSESIKIDEYYLDEMNYGETHPQVKERTVFEVPEKEYFVLGDNRLNSTDSRSCFAGAASDYCKDNEEAAYVNEKEIRGRAWIIWWPLSQMRLTEKTKYPELD